MLQKKFLILLITIILILTVVPTVSAQTNEESSYYYIVIDSNTGNVLLSQNSGNRIYPASTTKILTAYTALANSGTTTVFTVSKKAAGPLESGAVRLGLIEGEEMQMYDMLNALMLKSANDVAIAIAENIGGSVEVFSDMMNEKAAASGALDTHFTNPNGLHDDNHYTTVYDLAMITRGALNNYTFASIVSSTEYVLPATNKHDAFPLLRNSNPILGENDGMDFLVTGVKTGYTSKAKYTLVSSAHNYMGRDVICVVANIPSRAVSAALSLELMKKTFNEFAVQSISSSGQIISEGIPSELDFPVATARNIEYLMPVDKSLWQLKTEFNVFYDGKTKLEKGDIVGELTYIYNKKTIGSTYLVAAESSSPQQPIIRTVITEVPAEYLAAFPLRFLLPFSLAILATLLFYLGLRYNKKQVEE